MIHKLRTVDSFLYAILTLCVFSFKVYLIGVGAAGIRADDILILAAFVLLLFMGDLRTTKRSRPFNIYLCFVAINTASTVWNSAAGRVDPLTSSLFVVRLLQYMVFYYLGYRIAKSGIRITKMLSYYLALLCVLVPLQMLSVLPSFGAFAGITSRAVGNTNGPYELAVVAAFLLCYLGYNEKKQVDGVLSSILIFLSASRITFVATGYTVAKTFLKQSKSKRVIVARVALLTVLASIGLLAVHIVSNDSPNGQQGVLDRLSTAGSTGVSLNTLRAAYNAAPVYRNTADYGEGAFSQASDQANGGDGDASALTRVFRWTSLIKSTLSEYDSILIGLGPSFGTTAVDGYFVRVFIETGLFGLLAFCWFAKSVLAWGVRYSSPFYEYACILLLTGCFIDIFTSYKPMLFFWLWQGMKQFDSKKKIRKAITASRTELTVPTKMTPDPRLRLT